LNNDWPKILDGAVKICLLTMTLTEKIALKNTPKENLIMFHLGLAKNIRELFGMWEGNTEILESCGSSNPDEASMVIVEAVWKELNRQTQIE
jgi:hypothetical protein